MAPLPKMLRVRQTFAAPTVEDLPAAVRAGRRLLLLLDRLGHGILLFSEQAAAPEPAFLLLLVHSPGYHATTCRQ